MHDITNEKNAQPDARLPILMTSSALRPLARHLQAEALKDGHIINDGASLRLPPGRVESLHMTGFLFVSEKTHVATTMACNEVLFYLLW